MVVSGPLRLTGRQQAKRLQSINSSILQYNVGKCKYKRRKRRIVYKMMVWRKMRVCIFYKNGQKMERKL